MSERISSTTSPSAHMPLCTEQMAQDPAFSLSVSSAPAATCSPPVTRMGCASPSEASCLLAFSRAAFQQPSPLYSITISHPPAESFLAACKRALDSPVFKTATQPTSFFMALPNQASLPTWIQFLAAYFFSIDFNLASKTATALKHPETMEIADCPQMLSKMDIHLSSSNSASQLTGWPGPLSETLQCLTLSFLPSPSGLGPSHLCLHILRGLMELCGLFTSAVYC